MTDYPQTNDKLTERVWRIMQKHRGYDNRVSRDLLTLEVCGQDCMNWLDRGSWSVKKSSDRKVRDAIAELPIIWDDGYFIPRTFQEANKYQASMISRIASINKRLRILDTWLKENQQELRYEQEALWHG